VARRAFFTLAGARSSVRYAAHFPVKTNSNYYRKGEQMNEARKDAAAVAGARRPYAHYLERVEQSIADIELTCWYDFEPADRSVGLPATAWLIHARPAGSPCDIADILDSRVIKRLEREAAEVLDQECNDSEGGRYDFD